MNFPPEIDTVNARAWYMKEYLGMSDEEIAQELYYSAKSIPVVIDNAFHRQSSATIYRKQLKYCKDVCTDSTEICYTCHLRKFVLKFLVKKKDGMM